MPRAHPLQPPHAPASRLAHRLREETRPLHAAAERAGVMPALLRGELPPAAYLGLLVSLRALYATLEPALERHAAHPMLRPLRVPGLARLAALDEDIAAFRSDPAVAAAAAVEPVPAAQGYAQRLACLAERQPALLAAHAYLRYLGDLSGGQVLGRIVADTYAVLCASVAASAGPTADRRRTASGTRFYDFGGAARTQSAISTFRAGLEALPASPAEVDALVAEAARGYAAHAALFEQVAARPSDGGSLARSTGPCGGVCE